MDHYKLVKLANYLIKIAFKLKPRSIPKRKALLYKLGLIPKRTLPNRGIGATEFYQKRFAGKKEPLSQEKISPASSTSSGSDLLPVIGLGGLLGYVGLKASNKRKRK